MAYPIKIAVFLIAFIAILVLGAVFGWKMAAAGGSGLMLLALLASVFLMPKSK
jgi:hypothetical protein